MNLYEHVFRSVIGANMPLYRWRGQPILLVNTASKCGYAPQLAKLQDIYQDYRQSSLVIIGMPCNDFDEREPGDERQIAGHYWDQYKVSFPLTEKIVTMGHGAHPLFLSLLDTFGMDIMPRWNFTKYLFDCGGEFVHHWHSDVEPDDPTLTHEIERRLQSWIF